MNRCIRHIIYFFVFIEICFQSCQNSNKTEDVLITAKHDSLVEKLKSPDLKAVNAELLKEPNNAELFNKRSKIYMRLKQWDEAIGDALRAIAIDSAKADYYITLADVYFASNKTRYSKDMLESAVKKFPDNTDALLKLGELYFLVKQYENAFTYINKALKIDENIARAYYLKGTIYKELGDTTKAISSMRTAVDQEPGYFNAVFDIGVLYAARLNPMALEYYDNALRLKPNNEDVLYAKAKFFQDAGKINECIILYDQILTLNKNNEYVLYNLGAVYLEYKKDVNRAVDYFSKAIAVNPKYTEAYYARGFCFQKLKDNNNAKADYNMCLQLQPNYEPAIDGLNSIGK